MYKILSVEQYDFERFFKLLNLRTNEEIECFEPFGGNLFHEFDFIKKNAVYRCLIEMEAEKIDKIEKNNDHIYDILGLNISIGNCNFAKLELHENVYYVPMHMLGDIAKLTNKKTILLRQGQYSLLEVNGIIHDVYKT